MELVNRVTAHELSKNEKKDVQARMETMESGDGIIFGRAAILPTEVYRYGALVAGGLRISPIPHICGIMSGEIATVARDVGQLRVPPEVLAVWASSQALLIKRKTSDHEFQAKCAEIIAQCGGTILDLPVALWSDNWMNLKQLRSLFGKETEIIVHLGNVDHEDDDYVPKPLFLASLKLSSNVMFIPSVRGSLGRKSQLERLVRTALADVWAGYEAADEVRRVATAEGEDIERFVTIYSRPTDA
jgi:hypothetical protein